MTASGASPRSPLARFIDAQGHRVTASVTPSGLLVIPVRTVGKNIKSGDAALSPENARALRKAIDEYLEEVGS